MILGFQGLEEAKNPLADVTLIFGKGVQRVKKYNGHRARVLSLEVIPVCKRVGREEVRRSGLWRDFGERGRG
jgi:hypothetical protein